MKTISARAGAFNLLLGASILFPATVLADASDFSFVQAEYLSGDIADIDADGWRLSGSLELTDQFFVTADYAELEDDEDGLGFSAEADLTTVGLGYVFGANDAGSFYGTVNYVDVGATGSAGMFSASDSDEGVGLGLGTRINLSDQAELKLGVDYVDFGNDNDSTVPSIGLVYQFTPQVAGTADYSRDSGERVVGLGLRFYFDL